MSTRATPGRRSRHRRRPDRRPLLIGALTITLVAATVMLVARPDTGVDAAKGGNSTLLEAGGPHPATASPPTSVSPSPSRSSASPSPSKASPRKSTGPSEKPTAAARPATGFAAWPTPTTDRPVTATVRVSGSYDGGLERFHGSGALGGDGQDEDQDPLFELADGAILKNVVLGAPAADGVHCLGSCTLRNVWWEDVGEDAATFKGGSASATYRVLGGGARHADDKVFQHNGAGTVTVSTFQVADFGKLYRSCGNCDTQYERHVVISEVKVTGPGGAIAGINANYGDTATLSGVTITGDGGGDITVCDRFRGNDGGDEPVRTGTGADGVYCRYGGSDVTYS